MLFENFYKLVSDLKYYSKFKSFAKTVSSQIKLNLHFFLRLLYREYRDTTSLPPHKHSTEEFSPLCHPFPRVFFPLKQDPAKSKGTQHLYSADMIPQKPILIHTMKHL